MEIMMFMSCQISIDENIKCFGLANKCQLASCVCFFINNMVVVVCYWWIIFHILASSPILEFLKILVLGRWLYRWGLLHLVCTFDDFKLSWVRNVKDFQFRKAKFSIEILLTGIISWTINWTICKDPYVHELKCKD